MISSSSGPDGTVDEFQPTACRVSEQYLRNSVLPCAQPLPSGSETLLLVTGRGRFVGKHDMNKDDEDPQKKDGFWGRVPPEGTPGKHAKDDEDDEDDDEDE